VSLKSQARKSKKEGERKAWEFDKGGDKATHNFSKLRQRQEKWDKRDGICIKMEWMGAARR